MPDADPHSINHLDFEAGPVMCGCIGCPAVPHTREDPPCGGVATFWVKVHAVNHCEAADLTPDGGLVQLVCEVCLKARTARAKHYAKRLSMIHDQWGRAVCCLTCGKPLVDVDDLMEVRRLVER